MELTDTASGRPALGLGRMAKSAVFAMLAEAILPWVEGRIKNRWEPVDFE